ncbi:conserved membrane protein of unknown function [Bradyrhizobium sp. ORS 285]|uniref:hypothetical protein n=1 Tax=Bradyrhizobium sp. ORS 285 TaxID=115808 RepID=UPI0002407369|nr:hypothetical protein [Bradyrhizobium sp. ORS 285]CCD87907.1 conserved membrane hypothetical protein [Bradyrhizobium sp. ORS 285]SMX62034.1 conserved membrane protein of unknown function [Bradyrhizobium sp. ORS 285]
MTMNVDADGGLMLPALQATDRRSRLPVLTLLLVLVAAAVLVRHLVTANTDVSWLLIAAERWLDGQRLYSEILETNPPMAVLVYVPALLIASITGFPAEVALDALLFLAIALSVAVSMLVLRHSTALTPRQRWPMALAAVAVLAVLPAQCFGQREHIAVIELLPVLAVLSLRANGETPQPWAAIVAGLGLGLAVCFKPHFALAMLCVIAVVAAHLKSLRLLLAPENLVAALLLAIYGLCTVLFFPEFFTDMWPLIRDVYSLGLPLSLMVAKPGVALCVLILVAALLFRRGSAATPTPMVLLSASAAFLGVYLLQRKGFPYQSYPMLAFAWLGFFQAVTASPAVGRDAPARTGVAIAAMATALFAATFVWFNSAMDGRFLRPAIARTGIVHPTIIAVTGNAGIVHPLARAVGGVWSWRGQSLMVASYEDFARELGADPQVLARIAGYAQRERRWLAEDIGRFKPSILLVDNLTSDWGQWLRAAPELDRLLRDYRLAETVQDVDVYVRRSD